MTIKLNVGCGEKLYSLRDGWVNVDIVEPINIAHATRIDVLDGPIEAAELPVNTRLFLQDDMCELRYVDEGVVDEVHSYHNIEHIHSYKVVPTLRQWLRVLKSGGKVIIECPDILKCAAWLLTAELTGHEPTKMHLGLLGMYGEQNPDKPYMQHLWGWTPSMLMDAVEEAGFIDVEYDIAHTHMKEQRDMRIVAVKP